MKIIIVPDDGREYTLVPKVATEELLHSMAVRYDHGLGVPGYYDNPMFLGAGHKRRMESTISQMRQLHEEVVGTGFYATLPCKVVELPGKELAFSVWASEWVDGWNACLDEIERRAK